MINANGTSEFVSDNLIPTYFHPQSTVLRQLCGPAEPLPQIQGPKYISLHRHTSSMVHFCCLFKITRKHISPMQLPQACLLHPCSLVLSLDSHSHLSCILQGTEETFLPQWGFIRLLKPACKIVQQKEITSLPFFFFFVFKPCSIFSRGSEVALPLVITNRDWQKIIRKPEKPPNNSISTLEEIFNKDTVSDQQLLASKQRHRAFARIAE